MALLLDRVSRVRTPADPEAWWRDFRAEMYARRAELDAAHARVQRDAAARPRDPRLDLPLEHIPLDPHLPSHDLGGDDPGPAARFIAATEGVVEARAPIAGSSRSAVWCAACVFDRPRGPDGLAPGRAGLIIDHAPNGSLVAACLLGCSADAIARAGAIDVATWETELRDEQRAARELESDGIADLASPLALTARPVEWLIPDLLPARATTLLVGASGAKKSWVAIHAAICVAAGIPFLGRPVQRGKVLLLLLEDHHHNRVRIEAIARGLGTSLEQLVGWLDCPPPSIFKLRSDEPTSMRQLGEWQRRRGYSAIVVDNLSEIRSGTSQSSESDATVMGLALAPLKRLASDGTVDDVVVAEDPPSIMVLHHAGANGQPRGSTAILQHMTYAVQVEAASQRPEAPLTIDTIDGCRVSAPDFQPIKLRYRGVMPAAVVPEPAGDERRVAPPPKADDARAKILAALVATPGMNATALAEAVGGNKATGIAARKALADEDVIEQRADGLWYLAAPSS